LNLNYAILADLYLNVKNTVTAFLLISAIVNGQPEFERGQDWPKLMQLYESVLVDVKRDSSGKVWYADWQGKRISDLNALHDTSKAKYLYVGSTGKPLSNKLYQYASPFYKGLAVVGETETLYPDGPDKGAVTFSYGTAIINTREEEVLPMDERAKSIIGHGLILTSWNTDPNPVYSVYNKIGKKLLECSDCAVGAGVGMENFWMTTTGYGRPNSFTKLFDLKGRLLYHGPGQLTQQIDNQQRPQPYYKILLPENSGLNTILDRHGKVVMDSIGMSYFSLGKCTIYKNGSAAVVDTNWNFIIPFSYGYNSIQVLTGQPQGAYIATRNNNTVLIDAENKKLISFESSCGISYSNKQIPYYEICDTNRNRIYVGLNGDTLFNSRFYEIEQYQWSDIPGFLVMCKSNGQKGYLDAYGKVLIPCLYKNLFYTGKNDIIFFSHDGSCGYMDLKGRVKLSLNEVQRLTSFSKGYAHCMLKVYDQNEFHPDNKTFYEANGSYQLHERVIDSTGRFVAYETWPPALKNSDRTLGDGIQITSFFNEGFCNSFQ
jgi:hypothetical protein